MNYAVIRAKPLGENPAPMSPPAAIFLIDSETPKRLTGHLQDEAGRVEIMRLGLYDMRPRRVVDFGSVNKDREIIRFATFGSARLALLAMQRAWDDTSTMGVTQAREALDVARSAMERRKAEYMAALDTWMATEIAAFKEAQAEVWRAGESLVRRRNEAISAVAEKQKGTAHAA